MKKLFLISALGISSMLSLVAESANSCDEACNPCVCCDCDGPSTENVALTIPAGPHVGACSGFIVSADFLYWFSKESNLSYATRSNARETLTPATFDNFTQKSFQLDDTWEPGFKVALGMNSECDDWSLLAEYTWYHAHKCSSTSVDEFAIGAQTAVNGTESLMSPWVSSDAFTARNQEFFNRVAADWNLKFNQIDLTLSRHFWLSKSTTLKPFLGLRSGWTTTDFDVTGSRSSLTQSTTAKIHQTTWGVGLLTGLRSTYQFTNCFSLYGGGDIALLYGDRDTHKKVTASNSGETLSWTSHIDNCSTAQAALDLDLGLSYQTCWCDDQNRLSIDLGWEYHQWFNYSSRPLIDPFGSPDLNSESDLTLSGLIVKVRFDF